MARLTVTLLDRDDDEEALSFNPMRGRVKKIPPGVRRITLADYNPAAAGTIRKVLGHRWRPQRNQTNWINTELNREILGAPSADSILKTFEWHSCQFDRMNILTALHRVAKLAPPAALIEQKVDEMAARRLVTRAFETFPDLEIWEMLGMANTVWS